jgi:hypothetical protein
VVPQGIIFGADRNISFERKSPQVTKTIEGEHTTINIQPERYLAQSQRPKVLRWPKGRAVLGYVGEAQIGGRPTDEWLHDFIGDHPTIDDFERVAEDLRSRVEQQRTLDESDRDAQTLLIHLGGFERREETWVPVIWFIRNVHDMQGEEYLDVRKEFGKSEEFWRYWPESNTRHIRDLMKDRSSKYDLFGFQQGIALDTFNMLSDVVSQAFLELSRKHPRHAVPSSLTEWERYVRMSVLTFGAYFESYMDPGEQTVGGGADVVSIPWPEDSTPSMPNTMQAQDDLKISI